MWLKSPNIKGYLLKSRLLIYLFHCCGSGRGSTLFLSTTSNCLQKLWYEQFSTWNAYQAFLVAAHAITWYPYLRISIWLNISCILLVHFMLDVIYFSLANSQLELTLFTTQAQKNMFWRYFRNLFWSAIDFIFP